jgi:hypothetical protein
MANLDICPPIILSSQFKTAVYAVRRFVPTWKFVRVCRCAGVRIPREVGNVIIVYVGAEYADGPSTWYTTGCSYCQPAAPSRLTEPPALPVQSFHVQSFHNINATVDQSQSLCMSAQGLPVGPTQCKMERDYALACS